jgi:hypothetical protein
MHKIAITGTGYVGLVDLLQDAVGLNRKRQLKRAA